MCKLSTIDFRRGCCVMIRVYQDYLRITALPSGISAGAPVCDARPSLSRHSVTVVSGLNPPSSDGENVPFMKITDIQMCQVSPGESWQREWLVQRWQQLLHTHAHIRITWGGLSSPSTRLRRTRSSQLITEQNRC